MTRSWLLQHLTGLLLSVPMAVAAQAAQPIEVRFKAIDSAGQAIVGMPVRLVLALGQGWQLPEAGMRAMTGSGGEVNWTVKAAPERRRRKLPTNFFTQAVAPAGHHPPRSRSRTQLLRPPLACRRRWRLLRQRCNCAARRTQDPRSRSDRQFLATRSPKRGSLVLAGGARSTHDPWVPRAPLGSHAR